MNDTTRELIQLRDEHLKQALVRLAQKRHIRVSVLLRQMLEREVLLEEAYMAALVEESPQEAKARARRLKILLAPFWEYLAENGELPAAQARRDGGLPADTAPPHEPQPAHAGDEDFGLDDGIDGFAGGLSED
jgi:hypothetical protein